MWSYLKIELSKFFTNKKNIAIYVLLTSFAVYYALRVAPEYDPIEKVDINEIEASYLTREEFLINREGKDSSGSHPAIQFAMAIFPEWNEYEMQRMVALQAGDLKEYTRVTSEWYLYTDSLTYTGGYYYYKPRYYNYGNLYAHEEGHRAYLATSARYEKYAEMDSEELTLEVLEEFTAIQTLYRLMEDSLPYVFLVALLLLSVDIVLQDKKYPTLLRGYPIADWKKLLMKGVTSFIGGLALFIPILIGYILIGIQFGFGSLKLPIPVFVPSGDFGAMAGYKTIPMYSYFAQTGALLLGFFALIIAIVLLLSVVFRTEILNLIAGLGFIASEAIYYERGNGYLYAVENYIPTYLQVSHIVTNSKNSFYDSTGIELSKGLMLVGSCTIILLVITLLISLSKRYKFIR